MGVLAPKDNHVRTLVRSNPSRDSCSALVTTSDADRLSFVDLIIGASFIP
jgi:hypothetical protein